MTKNLANEAILLEKRAKMPKATQMKTARYLQRLYDIYEEEVFELGPNNVTGGLNDDDEEEGEQEIEEIGDAAESSEYDSEEEMKEGEKRERSEAKKRQFIEMSAFTNSREVEMVFDDSYDVEADGSALPKDLVESESDASDTLNTTENSSQNSTRVIEFEEDGTIKKPIKKKESAIMMVDLKQKKNMAQLGIKEKINLISMHDIGGPSAANKRKREKRKLKKDQEKVEKQQAEQEKKAREDAAALAKYKESVMKGKADSKIVGPEGKVLRKKVLPTKAKVVDEKGEEWEMVQVKKTVLVEQSGSDDDSY